MPRFPDVSTKYAHMQEPTTTNEYKSQHTHRIEKTVFASRVDIMQFVPIVAKYDEGNDWNSKHIKHNHGDLCVHMHSEASQND